MMRRALYACAFILGCAPFSAFAESKLDPINHIIVIYLENHSFDNIYGTFPGADGLSNIKNVQTQGDGTPFASLPQAGRNGEPDTRFWKPIPNAPFSITHYRAYDEEVPDPVHRFYQTQAQINDGAMDKFVQYTNVGALVMGYYEQKDSPLWQYAQQYTLADRFFTAAFGGSLLNHFWLVCACTPRYENPPSVLVAKLDAGGKMLKDGELTPDGYLVNNLQPFSKPYDWHKALFASWRLPAVKLPTIGDRLSEKNISWAWYAGGWDEAVKGDLQSFIPHHQPFLYFANYAEGSPGRTQHLKDEKDFLGGIRNGTLPAVSFYKPAGIFDGHPGYSTLKRSEDHVFAIVRAIEQSPLWKDSLIIITFDDSGGFYDHVAPPRRDRFGPGMRIPTLVISQFAKRGFIDHTDYDSTSILKLIEARFGLAPLNDSYKNAGDLTNTLE